MSTEADYRLPRNVVPSHYDISLEPDLGAATFTGHVGIDVQVNEATQTVAVNGVELVVNGVEVVNPASRERVAATAQLEPDHERIVFVLEHEIGPGGWRLEVDFSGTLNDQLRGFYRSVYQDDAGTDHVLATTQFEATEARRAFPCWDEPDLKATFAVSLAVADDLMAVSCGPVIAEEPIGDGRRWVRFGTTMKLSTYLVAFVVGPLEATAPLDVDGTPLRVIHVPGKGHLAGFAEEFGAFALRFFADYYGIPYPGEKLDLLAIPDFAAGAMENLGAVTFRESLLLIDPAAATQDELTRVADVIAHELAHMWFGDLVTMRWWNGLWLKEAFATFMEMVCVDAFRPEWRRWAAFAAERDHSMDTDGLRSTRPIEFPVASPEDADAMFDVITYSKGAAVLRMLQQFLGEEVFRRGISQYLTTHAYGNAETHHLWEALEEASDQPVRAIMDSWIFQGGHPQIEVAATDDGYVLRQERFQFIGESTDRWQVPVLYRTDEAEARVVVDDDVAIPPGEGLFVNSGGNGYFRTRYVGALHTDIGRRLPKLGAEERHLVVADAWANTLAAETSAASFLDLIATLRGERDVEVLGAMVGGLRELNRVISSDGRPALQQFVRSLVGPAAADVGWAVQPGESDVERRFRGAVLTTLGVLGADEGTIGEARGHLAGVLDGTANLDGEVAAAAIDIVAANGDASDHERFASAMQGAASPQDRERYLNALAAIPDVSSAHTTLQMVLDGRIRSQNSMRTVSRLIANRIAGVQMWSEVEESWDELLAIMPPFSARNMIGSVHLRSEPDVADDIRRWLADHPLPGGEQLVAQQLERLAVRVMLREREEAVAIPSFSSAGSEEAPASIE